LVHLQSREVQVACRLGHELLDAVSSGRALDALDRPSAIDAGELTRCNANIQRELSSKLADAEAAIARVDRNGARARINAIDAHYGGLAAPAIVELDAKLPIAADEFMRDARRSRGASSVP
jgi:hypothetical protein